MQLKLLFPIVFDNLKKRTTICTNSPTNDCDDDDDDDDDQSEHQVHISQLFHHGIEKSVPTSNEDRLCWVRNQIISMEVELETPFGKRHLTYADHTASGRSLHYIENYITTIILPSYGNTHTSDSYVGYNTTKVTHEAGSYVKKCLGGGEEDAIIFCGSGSTAAIKRLQEVMGISISSILRDRMLNCMNNEERWVVFVGPYEHHSNILSWRQSLAEVVEIGLDGDGLMDMNALKQQLEYYKSRNYCKILGSFSACSNVTGVYTDTRGIARLLHQFGGFACFDFAACGPYIKIDMHSGEADGYDAIFLSVHKFLGGPGTPGILLMKKALYLLGSSAPSTCGGGTVDFVNNFNETDTLYVGNIEEREMSGTPPIIQIIRAALAFWIKEYIGHTSIEMKEETYINKAFERLLPNPNIWILGNTTSKRQAILSFLIFPTTNTFFAAYRLNEESRVGLGPHRNNEKPLHGRFVAKLLNDLFGIQARGGCACAGPYGHKLLNIEEHQSLAFRSAIQKGYDGIKPGWTRVSFPYYMSEEEFEFILAALEFVAAYGQRFLFLYDFNWRTGSWSFKNNYNKIGSSSFALMIMKLTPNHNENQTSTMVRKFVDYLEKAKQIAHLLPEFPPKVEIPQEIADLVSFTI